MQRGGQTGGKVVEGVVVKMTRSSVDNLQKKGVFLGEERQFKVKGGTRVGERQSM